MIAARASIALPLLLALGCSPAPAPDRPASEGQRPDQSPAAAEVRAIADECVKKEAGMPASGYSFAPDPRSARRTDDSDIWLIDMVEWEPWRGRLPPPGPPERHVFRVHIAQRSCELLTQAQSQ